MSQNILPNNLYGQKKLLDALINLSVLKYGKDVTPATVKGSGVKRTIQQTEIVKGQYKKALMVGGLKRLFNDVQTKPGNVKENGYDIMVTDVLGNPFCEIDDITYPKATTKPTTAVIVASQKSNVELKFYIKSKPKKFEKTFADGQKSQEIFQEAIIDFGATPMTVEFRLYTKDQGKDKFVFNSKYKFTPDGIELFPWTDEETKKIKPIVKKIYQETQLPKSVKSGTSSQIIGTKVNVFHWVNSVSPTRKINLNSTLDEIRPVLDSLKSDSSITETASNHSAIKKWIVEHVLLDESTLDKHKEDVRRWFKNYQEYHGDDTQYTAETLNFECEYEEHIPPHISEYTSKLVDRTTDYDTRIRARPAIPDIDAKLAENEEKRRKALDEQIEKYNSLQQHEKEPTRSQELLHRHNANIERINKKFDYLAIELRRLEKFKVLDGEFGIYPPYLVSDILRHRSTFVKQHTVDELCITSNNITAFCSFIHGFKSQAFTFISLYMQLISGYNDQFEAWTSKVQIPQTKIDFEFFMPFYKGLDFMNEETKKKLALTTGQTQSPSLLTSSPFGVSVSQDSQELLTSKSTSTSTTVSTLPSQPQIKLNFSEESYLTIKHKLLFNSTATSEVDLIKIVTKFTEDQQPQPLRLLKVKEPMFGDLGAVQDFDVLHCQNYLKVETKVFSQTTTLSDNFLKFLTFLGNYEPDQQLLDAVEDLSEYFPILKKSSGTGSGSGSGAMRPPTFQVGYLPKPTFDDWPAKRFTKEKDKDIIEVEIDLPKSNSSGNIVLVHASDSYNSDDVIINGNKITIKPFFRKDSTESNPISIRAIQEEVPLNFSQGQIQTQILIYKEVKADRKFDTEQAFKDDSKRTFGATEIADKEARAKHQAWLQREEARYKIEAESAAAKAEAKRRETPKMLRLRLETEKRKELEQTVHGRKKLMDEQEQKNFEIEKITEILLGQLKQERIKVDQSDIPSFVEDNFDVIKNSTIDSIIQHIREKGLDSKMDEPSNKSDEIPEIIKPLWEAEKAEKEKDKLKADPETTRAKKQAETSAKQKDKPRGSYEKYIKYKTKYLELKAKLNL